MTIRNKVLTTVMMVVTICFMIDIAYVAVIATSSLVDYVKAYYRPRHSVTTVYFSYPGNAEDTSVQNEPPYLNVPGELQSGSKFCHVYITPETGCNSK